MSASWVPLVALPSRDWGSVSVAKLAAVVGALGADPALTEVSSIFDDEGATWIAVLVPPPEPPRPTEEPPAEEPEPPAAPAPASIEAAKPEPVACDICGKSCATRQGMLVHRTRTHGAATPAKAPAPEPGPLKGHQLVCGEPGCHFTTQYALDLNTHCLTTHQRRATTSERIPQETG